MSNSLNEVGKLSPREFARIIKQYEGQIARIKQEKANLLNNLKKQYDGVANPIQKEKELLQNKYLLDNPLGIMVYVDHLDVNGQSLYYSDNLKLRYESQKQQVARRLKNGRISYSTKTIKYIVFTTNKTTVELATAAKVVDIKKTIKYIEEAIDKYPESKNVLDAQILEVDRKISSITNKYNQLSSNIESKCSQATDQLKEKIDTMMAHATKRQWLITHKKYAVILAVVVLLIIVGIIGAINNSIERNRDYYIDIDDKITLNCNLWQDAESGNFQCSNGVLAGKFSKYDTAELDGDSELSIDGSSFIYSVASPIISAKQYRTKDYSIDSITGKFKDIKSKLWIYNTYLRENVLEKSIAVSWRFSDDDIAKLNEANQKWLDEERVREEAERQAAEAAKAAEEQRKAEEAQKAAQEAAEKAAVEAAAQRAAQQSQSTYTGTTTQNQTTSSTSSSQASNTTSSANNGSGGSNYSPNSGVNWVVSGYCNDGTYVTGDPSAKGRANACYGHKGWRDY